jgi:hypothetical protein
MLRKVDYSKPITGDDIREIVAFLASLDMHTSLEAWQYPGQTLLRAADDIDRLRTLEARDANAAATLADAYGPDWRGVLKSITPQV